MKQKLDSLFWRFAEEKFVYGGVYPYYTELVFAFADYVENAGDDELRRLLPGCCPSLLRKTVRRGTDKWLRRHAKTMMLL